MAEPVKLYLDGQPASDAEPIAGSRDGGHVTVRTTGVGSMPGVNALEAAAISAGEFDIPFLPELPERGPGSDMVGRAMARVHAITGDFAVATTASGWQLAAARSGGEPGRAMRRGANWWREDLDALEINLLGFGGTVKVALAGPWTLAASVENRSGHRLLADRGACEELAGAVAIVAGELAREMYRRVPGAARVMVVLDEPLLPTVMHGKVRTASGRGYLAIPDDQVLRNELEVVVKAITAARALPGMHCCARQVPFDLAARAGFELLSFDSSLVSAAALDDMGRWWDRGAPLALGVVPALAAVGNGAWTSGVVRSVAGVWDRIGFSPDVVGPLTILTPSCGLVGASAQWARSVGGQLRRAARMLADVD